MKTLCFVHRLKPITAWGLGFLVCSQLGLVSCSPTESKPAALPAVSVDRDINRWPQLKLPFDPAETQAINAKIEQLLKTMTLEQKVGQMTQAEIGFVTPDDVRKYHLGSVLEGGGSYLDGNKFATIDEWLARLDQFYAAATDTRDGGPAIPLIWGTDAVHGHNKVLGATIFPHNVGLGATRNPQLVEEIARVTAVETMVLGKDWTFAPEISVTRNDRWGRTYEGYSEEPGLVAELGKAAVEGFQGRAGTDSFMNGQRLLATAKHYIGDGGTENGVDRANTLASEPDLIRLHAPGYFAAIEAGVLSIMASHSSWQGTRMHGHQYLLTDVLKNRLGFDGFVVGDWNSHALIPGCKPDNCPAAIMAGVDMFMVPEHWKSFIANTVQQVKEGVIPESRINDAVARILRSKYRAGIMDSPKPSRRPLAGKKALFAAPDHIALARQAVRESAVLIKNNPAANAKPLLPLHPKQRILVVGPAADDIGRQSGGWTLSWQGTGTTNDDFPKGQSIYQGIKQQVAAAGGKVELSLGGDFQHKPDVAIMVFGEKPYAEWQGDIKTLAWQYPDKTDAKILEQLKAQGIPVVSIFISGRPLWLNREINASTAFIAAWLPGSQGGALADLIFTSANGDMQQDFTGTLPLSWPKRADQAEVNWGDSDYDPLFPMGYGLRYSAPTSLLADLDTDIGRALDGITLNTPLFKGRAQAPWGLWVESGAESALYQSALIKTPALQVTEADQDTQGDALDVKWSGSSEAQIALRAEDVPLPFGDYVARNSIIAFDIYRLSKASQPLYLVMRDNKKAHKIEMNLKFNASPINEWNRLSVDIACFEKAGLDMAYIQDALAIQTAGAVHFRLANVQIEPDMADKAAYRCR
jgi:beta-glucosidase